MPGQLNWTTDPGLFHFMFHGEVKAVRFSKIAFVPGFVLIEEEDGIVRGRPAKRVLGMEFDKKGKHDGDRAGEPRRSSVGPSGVAGGGATGA